MTRKINAALDEVLREEFYTSPPARAKAVRPDHYEVICISMYKDDLARLDAKVAQLKSQGHRKMSRSALIRFALDQVDTKKLPRSY
jgi:hypothetical protein